MGILDICFYIIFIILLPSSSELSSFSLSLSTPKIWCDRSGTFLTNPTITDSQMKVLMLSIDSYHL